MGAGSAGILPALGASVAGRDMRPAAHSLSFASPKESKQRKGDPKSATPSLRYGANLGRGACGVCRRTHCALRASFKQPRQVRQRSMGARAPMLTPQTPRPRRSPRGLNSPTRAIAALGPDGRRRFAPRSARPSVAMARLVPPLPSGRAEKRRARGGLAPQDASLRELTCRSCLNEARSAQ